MRPVAPTASPLTGRPSGAKNVPVFVMALCASMSLHAASTSRPECMLPASPSSYEQGLSEGTSNVTRRGGVKESVTASSR
jgi:hypothetical protein